MIKLFKTFVILSVLLILYSILVMVSKPAVVAFLKNKIEHAVADSKVSGVEVNLNYSPWSLLYLRAVGDISIDAFEHDKVKVQDIKAHFRWAGWYIYLDSLSGKIINGTMDGKGIVTLGSPLKYVLEVNFANLDLARFVEDFKLNGKFLLAGMLNGKATLSGAGKNIQILNGDFASPVSGGDLDIKDTQFLENMAINSKLPSNLVVDSFKNYHYNVGLVKMSLDHGDLGFDVSLEGATGKRNLKVLLHDFNLN